MVKNRHFLPFFGPKTPFFRIFWHPVYPPSKTPFLADFAPTPAGRRAARHQNFNFSPLAVPGPQRSEWGWYKYTFYIYRQVNSVEELKYYVFPLRGHLNRTIIVCSYGHSGACRKDGVLRHIIFFHLHCIDLLTFPRSRVAWRGNPPIRRVQVTRTYTRETWRHRKLTERTQTVRKSGS